MADSHRSRWTRREFGKRALAVGALPAFTRAAWPLSKWTAEQPAEMTAAAKLTEADSLRAHAAARGLLFGAAINPALIDLDSMNGAGASDGYTQLFGGQCGILVAENAMKWAALRPAADRFDFSGADKLMRFAGVMGQRVRGHNLCWHEALPRWFAGVATRENARQLLTDHIHTVCAHFAGKMQSWDVVNEAIDAAGGRPDGLRTTPWLELIGPGYIELAFQTAAEADPAAKLVYNDYGIELDTPDQAVKRGQVLLLVRRMKARGIPIHAVGVQSHIAAGGAQPGEGLRTFIRDAARLGLDVYITEMDVKTVVQPASTEEEDAAVAKVYADYLGMVLAEPNVPVALTWGLINGQSWLNHRSQNTANVPQRPLPFDDAMNPTPAFFALRSAIDRAHPADPQPAPSTSSPPGEAASDSNLYQPFSVEGSPTAKPGAPQQ